VSYGFWRAFEPPELTELTVRIPGLPPRLSGMTIVHLTDIHVGAWVDREFTEALAAEVSKLKPDLIAITGDLVDGRPQTLAASVAPIATVPTRFGTFFAHGNHEFYSGAGPWTRALEGMGVQVLRNRAVSVGEGADLVDIVGVDDWSARARGFQGGYDLDQALRGRGDRPAVLLAHQPRGFESAAAKGIALQLSGHTHGGQLFPWTLLVRAAFHPYFAGRYDHAGSTLFVSRGCGFWGPPVRIGAPPELARITLV